MEDDDWEKLGAGINAANRLSVNFRSLLRRTKTLFDTDETLDYWRAKHQLKTLREFLLTMKKDEICTEDQLGVYEKEVEFLEKLLKAEEAKTATEKLQAASSITIPGRTDGSRSSVESPKILDYKGPPLGAIRKRTSGKYSSEVRNELFSKSTGSQVSEAVAVDSAFDQGISYNEKFQEKLTEELMTLTRGLKKTIEDSGRVVKEDTKMVKDMTDMTDKNYVNLSRESARLEKHAYRSCDCWIWVSLFFVCISFIGMVLFMRVFTKRSWF